MRPLLLVFVLTTATAARCAPALEQLQTATPPVFRSGHTLIPLSIWGPELPLATRVELADHWGYCLYFGRLRPELVKELDDPASITAQVCALARAQPQRYPLQVITAPGFTLREYQDKLPEACWVHDQEGKLPDGKQVWSTEAPDEAFEMIADAEAAMIQEVLKHAPIALLTNGGEYATSCLGWHKKLWEQDPKIQAARGDRDWWEYLAERKTHQEMIISTRLRALVPDRRLYIYYYTEPPPFRMRWGGWKDWCWDYKHFRTVSDICNTSIYWRPGEDCWVGPYDLLTHATNAVGQQLPYGDTWSYNWMSPGWEVKTAKQPWMSEPARYFGYLKCYYTAGMVGGVAGYFAYDSEDNWIWQLMCLGHVQALFSHLDGFVRNSELLPGPDQHVWSADQPAYELPTGAGREVRVLARKHQRRAEWLLTAWDTTGRRREVAVEAPELGRVTLEARGSGSVYHAKLVAGRPVLTLLDRFGQEPTKGLAPDWELQP